MMDFKVKSEEKRLFAQYGNKKRKLRRKLAKHMKRHYLDYFD